MSCTCECCGKKYKVDLIIDDRLWKLISPNHTFSGLLCAVCIVNKLEEFGYNCFYLAVAKN